MNRNLILMIIGEVYSLLFTGLTRFALNPLIGLRRRIKDYRSHGGAGRLADLQKRLLKGRSWLFKQWAKYPHFAKPESEDGYWE